MRRWIGVVTAVAGVAASLALPSAASDEQIHLTIVGKNRVELTELGLGRENTTESIRFDYSPPEPFGQGFIATCRNGRFDRATLLAEGAFARGACSSGIPGQDGASGDATTAHMFPQSVGRYEAVQTRRAGCEWCEPPVEPHWNVSNIVTFDVVDPCRLTLVSFESRTRTPGLTAGAPMDCNLFLLEGRAELRGEDRSSIRLAASNGLTLESSSKELGGPVLRLSASGNRADVAYRLGPRLGGFVLTYGTTPAVTAISLGQSDVTLTHRNGQTTMRVRRRPVVAVRLTFLHVLDAIKRACGNRRPTVKCLARIRYRLSPGQKIERATIVRAGQTRRFKRVRGVARPI